ncbi:MAG: sigma 54-interacting transcriptional regulator [Methylacidiphilales bacterium]|nr:sigma 54-interacting transcriptional regulator [Candidatus Methylacidiphilales bacterium]
MRRHSGKPVRVGDVRLRRRLVHRRTQPRQEGTDRGADKGTLFLDEVGEIPLHCQAKLLKFLEDGVVQRVGATGGRRVSIQLFSATNRDLLDMSRSGAFRKDLYYRLSSLTLTVPALRETRDLIPDLVRIFVARLNARRDRPFSLDAACLRRLIEYDYPGNIREMQNIIEHLAVMCDGLAGEEHLPASVLSATSQAIAAPCRSPGNGTLLPFSCFPEPTPSPVLGIPTIADPASFFAAPASGGFPVASLKDEVRRYEKYLVREAVRRAGSKRKAAELLSVDIATVVRKTREADEVEDG